MEALYVAFTVAVMIGLSLYLLYKIYKESEHPTPPSNSLFAPCSRSRNEMVDLKKQGKHCYSDIYYAVLPNNLKVLVSPVSLKYEYSYSDFCNKRNQSGLCSAPNRKYNRCISTIKPVNCNSPSHPVAYLGSTLYYVYSSAEGVICKGSV
ncbi:hypothetical protein GAYE_SCF56G6342 [Galdieria yellowstonensis]|uniref:Uncharacterized protein n=1 Tax=Galdieria yellowstonensis TaxID=3028027 RepID=A0AAV9ILJ1_9RHOD|nr:hypothetical protein GAYE_SCF56G6342 [Galdieria yellowstonensis]